MSHPCDRLPVRFVRPAAGRVSALFAVTLDMMNPETVDDVLARHPRVTMTDLVTGPFLASATFTGPVGALVDMIRSDWDDGSGDDPGERYEFRALA